MGHYTPNVSFTNKKLEAAMHAEMYERNIQCPQLQKTLHLAASLIEVRWISYNINLMTNFLSERRLGTINARSKRKKSSQCIIGTRVSHHIHTCN